MAERNEPMRTLTTYFEGTAELDRQGQWYDRQRLAGFAVLVGATVLIVVLLLWLL